MCFLENTSLSEVLIKKKKLLNTHLLCAFVSTSYISFKRKNNEDYAQWQKAQDNLELSEGDLGGAIVLVGVGMCKSRK